MNDNQFSGDKLYEKDYMNKSPLLTPKRMVIIIGIAIVILLAIWIGTITGVFSGKSKNDPIIYLNGNKVINLEQGADYTDPGVQAIDKTEGLITSRVKVSGSVDTAKIGTYYITYEVTNAAGKKVTSRRQVNIVSDIHGPVVTFSPDGDNTEAKTHSSKVSVFDSAGIKVLKYQWTSNTTKPLETTFNSIFISDDTIASPEGINGNYYLWIYAEDTKGNVNVVSSKVFKLSQTADGDIDNTAPSVTFEPNGNSFYAQSHSTKVTLSDKSSIETSKYQWTTNKNKPQVTTFSTKFESGDTIKTPSAANGDYYLWIYVVDIKGNADITSSNVFKVNPDVIPEVDNKAPIITFVPNGNTTLATKHSTKVTAADSSGVKTLKYQWTNSTTKPAASSFSSSFNSGNTLYSPDNVTGNYYLWIYAVDTQNNATIEGSKAFSIGTPSNPSTDHTGPTISFGTNGINYAKSGSTVVSVNDASGVKVAKYQWTTSQTTPAATAFTTTFPSGNTISTPSGVTGTYYLWIYAEDSKGNNTIIGSKSFAIDNTAPSCSTSGGSSDWTTTSKTISIKCSDAHSGVATCNGNSNSSTSVSYSSTVNKTYSYTVVDRAGNSSTCTATVKIDKSAPTCSVSGANSTWTKQAVPVTITWSDSGSGVNDAYKVDNRLWQADVTVETFTTTIQDKVGNQGTCTFNVYHDGKEPTCAPIVTGTYPAVTSWKSGWRNMSIRCEDEQHGSGLSKCGGYTYPADSNGSLYIYDYKTSYYTSNKAASVAVYDRAGNSHTCTFDVKVDNTAPAKPTYSRKDTSTGSIFTAYCGGDINSGVNTSSCLRYCVSKSTSCTPSTTSNSGHSFSVNDGWVLCSKTVDIVGNSSSAVCDGY